MPETLSDQAVAARNLAAHARRLATVQTNAAEKARLAEYAKELEARADDLDREAAAL
jgi:hypothetical protein